MYTRYMYAHGRAKLTSGKTRYQAISAFSALNAAIRIRILNSDTYF